MKKGLKHCFQLETLVVFLLSLRHSLHLGGVPLKDLGGPPGAGAGGGGGGGVVVGLSVGTGRIILFFQSDPPLTPPAGTLIS